MKLYLRKNGSFFSKNKRKKRKEPNKKQVDIWPKNKPTRCYLFIQNPTSSNLQEGIQPLLISRIIIWQIVHRSPFFPVHQTPNSAVDIMNVPGTHIKPMRRLHVPDMCISLVVNAQALTLMSFIIMYLL